MRRFGWIGVVLVLLLTLVAGGIGYSLGAANATANAVTASGAQVTYVVQSGWGFGFPFVGLFVGFLLFALIVGVIRRAAWGGRGGWAQMHAAGSAGPSGGAGAWGPRGPWAGRGWGPRPDGCGPAAQAGSPEGGAPQGGPGSAP